MIRHNGATLFFAVMVFLCSGASVHAASCEGMPGFCQGDVMRIETAFEAGMDSTKTREERMECLRVRNQALAQLVERTYQSTLAWMADRGDVLRVLQEDQALWQEAVTGLLDPFDGTFADRMRSRERASEMLLGRLRVFGRLTSEAAWTDESL